MVFFFFFKDLFNKYNIIMLMQLKVIIFLLKNNNYLLNIKYLLQNAQVPIQIYYFKLLNMCKFAYDRKTQFLIVRILQLKQK
jgi:hypothetical protein